MIAKTPLTSFAATTFAALIASGCSFSAPERPAYDVPDQIGADVDPSQIVGTWRITPLNPYPDQPEQDTVIEYRDDGTVVGRTTQSDEQTTSVFGEEGLVVEMRGSWAVEAGTVRHADTEVEVLTDNSIAKLAGNVLSDRTRNISSSADIRELDAERIVMLGDDGAAVRYDRVR